MLCLVALKRISSDIPASNFDRNELEIAGELSLALGSFAIPRRGGARQQWIQSRKRAFSVSRCTSGEAVKSQMRAKQFRRESKSQKLKRQL